MNLTFFRTIEAQFSNVGSLTSLGSNAVAGLDSNIRSLLGDIDDLIVVSHGWSNGPDEARMFYFDFFSSVAHYWSKAGLNFMDQRRTAVLAITWPAKRFDEVNLAQSGGANPIDYCAAIKEQITNLKDAYGQSDETEQQLLNTAFAQVPLLHTEDAQDAYVAALVALLPASSGEADPWLDLSNVTFALFTGSQILNMLQTRLGITAVEPAGIQQSAFLLLNFTTYRVMNERAGAIGKAGPAQLVREALGGESGLRVHLVGHGFGGHLVMSLANHLSGGAQARSMTLLQATCSQFVLAAPDGSTQRPIGAFREVITKNKVRDTIAITHSSNDKVLAGAYGVNYVLTAQIESSIEIKLVDQFYYWGALGLNGARETAEAYNDSLHEQTCPYAELPPLHLIRNLEGGAFISNHGDVVGPQVAWAFLQSFLLGRR